MQGLVNAVSRGDSPGVVALIVGPDGVLYEGAAGKLTIAHDTAMPVDAIFLIASMTKPFIQMLLDGGHVGTAKILSEKSVKMMGENNIGSIFVEQQPDASQTIPVSGRSIQ